MYFCLCLSLLNCHYYVPHYYEIILHYFSSFTFFFFFAPVVCSLLLPYCYISNPYQGFKCITYLRNNQQYYNGTEHNLNIHKQISNHQNLSYDIHKNKSLTILSPNTISKGSTNAKLTILRKYTKTVHQLT